MLHTDSSAAVRNASSVITLRRALYAAVLNSSYPGLWSRSTAQMASAVEDVGCSPSVGNTTFQQRLAQSMPGPGPVPGSSSGHVERNANSNSTSALSAARSITASTSD